MIRPLRHAVAVLAAGAAALAVLAPTIASADQFFLDDAEGDVWEQVDTFTDTTYESGEPTRAGSVPNADLTQVRVAHSARKVKVWADYVDLRKGGEDIVIFGLGLRTDERVRRDSFVLNLTRHGRAFMTDRVGRGVPCRGLRGEIQWPQEQIEIDVPRRCLSRPTWVEFRAYGGRFLFESTPRAEIFRSYIDAAGKTGWNPREWSPRLFRG